VQSGREDLDHVVDNGPVQRILATKVVLDRGEVGAGTVGKGPGADSGKSILSKKIQSCVDERGSGGAAFRRDHHPIIGWRWVEYKQTFELVKRMILFS